jgi:NAD(P)H-hydrate epimerase
MDRQATEHFSIPSLTLMENAGRAVVEAAAEMIGGLRGRKICIFCGKGNNGGDGLVAGRHLLRLGAEPAVFLLGSFQDLKPDPGANLDMAGQCGLSVTAVPDNAALEAAGAEARRSVLVIDALLGTGFSPPVRGIIADAITLINGLGIPVLAVDIPSGLSADTGLLSGAAVSASRTVTFGLPKVGQFLYPAAEKYGALYLSPIGFPTALEEKIPASHHLVTAGDVSRLLAPRSPSSHKGTFGHALLLAGSRGLAGASILAARGVLRAGAGLVTVAVPESQAPPVLDSLPEAMVLPLPETGRGAFGERAGEVILEALSDKKVLAVGPGLSLNAETARLVRGLIPRVRVPMVIDADALNALAESPSVLLESKAEVIITPHPGELGRLLGLTAADVQARRIELSREFSRKYGVLVILKGAHTVIASPAGEVFVNSTGNPGMAAGGMGDVLTGIVASFIAQGRSMLDSAVMGTFLHGRAGDLAAFRVGDWGYLAGEVADLVPSAVREALSREEHEDINRQNLQLLRP